MSEARQRYCSGIIPFQLICIVLGLTLALLAGCDRDTTLVEPPDFFDFDPDNAWPQCNVPPEPAPVQGSPPQPAGIRIEACPNPAPPGTQKITFRFSLSINARANLGILDDRGRLIRKLLVDTNLSAGTNPEFTWNIIDVPPGDYRAYFRTGKEESQGDLRIE